MILRTGFGFDPDIFQRLGITWNDATQNIKIYLDHPSSLLPQPSLQCEHFLYVRLKNSVMFYLLVELLNPHSLAFLVQWTDHRPILNMKPLRFFLLNYHCNNQFLKMFSWRAVSQAVFGLFIRQMSWSVAHSLATLILLNCYCKWVRGCGIGSKVFL